MADVKIELDHAGIVSLLKSSEIADACEKQARKMTLATGMKYEPDVYVGKSRVNAGGYQNSKDGKQGICPKCGQWHPNCNCK